MVSSDADLCPAVSVHLGDIQHHVSPLTCASGLWSWVPKGTAGAEHGALACLAIGGLSEALVTCAAAASPGDCGRVSPGLVPPS